MQVLLHSRGDGDRGRVSDPDVATLTAAQLAREGSAGDLAMTCLEAVELFRCDPRLYAVPVLDHEGHPFGILLSLQFLHRRAERYFLEIHGRRSCQALVDANPLVFDAGASLRTMSEAIANIDDRFMVDGFVVTRAGRYIGVGRTSELLKALSDLQVVTAQNANPLTRLPGNLAIDRQLARVSGGELQRIALARVLLVRPALLLADEPTSRLDPVSQQQAMQVLLRATAEADAALLLVTRDDELANAVGNRRLTLGASAAQAA